jgi:DNA-binding NarL/FixJ family response regulator
MKNILIIEDDDFKRDHIKDFLISLYPYILIEADSNLSSAILRINKEEFDLIIVDMALPSHPVLPGGGSPISMLSGGLEVLLELQSLNRGDKCIIVTQYPEIEISGIAFPTKDSTAAIRKHLNYSVYGCLQYSEESPLWKIELKKLFEDYENSST